MENDALFGRIKECEPYYAGELKTKVTKGPPKLDLEKWRRPGVRDRSNCLTVAMDLIDRGESTPGFLKMPAHVRQYELDSRGYYEGRPCISPQSSSLSPMFLERALGHDGIVRVHEHGGHKNDHIVALFYTNGWSDTYGEDPDFDAYGRTEEGIWMRGKVMDERYNRNIEIEICEYAGVMERLWGEERMLKKHAFERGYGQHVGFFKMPDTFEYYPDQELVKLELDSF